MLIVHVLYPGEKEKLWLMALELLRRRNRRNEESVTYVHIECLLKF